MLYQSMMHQHFSFSLNCLSLAAQCMALRLGMWLRGCENKAPFNTYTFRPCPSWKLNASKYNN